MRTIGTITTVIMAIGLLSVGAVTVNLGTGAKFLRSGLIFMLGGQPRNELPATQQLYCDDTTGECY